MNEYPTSVQLRRIRKWDFTDIPGCFAYLHDLWKYADAGFWKETQRRIYISTAGWSGNEDLIGALRANFLIWSLCWLSHSRGGHYVFQKRRMAKPRLR